MLEQPEVISLDFVIFGLDTSDLYRVRLLIGSGVSREVHTPLQERPEGKFRRSTHPLPKKTWKALHFSCTINSLNFLHIFFV